MIYRIVFLVILCSSVYPLRAQLTGDMEDESRLYASTKQVNQFFRRFNGEEDEKGNRYYPRDKNYRSVKLRKKYLGILFDASNSGIKDDVKVQFAKAVLEKTPPAVLDFHGPNWFCRGADHLYVQWQRPDGYLVHGARAGPWRQQVGYQQGAC